ncbi:hypothetical protein STRDD11_02100 [Streptococcus sp. DD11]|nr:hypothetical protein STRDD11_02100 [Streptococcus sp. DD11]
MLVEDWPQAASSSPALSATPVTVSHFDAFMDKPPLMLHFIT